MPRSRTVPSYRLHKPTGQAVVTIRTPDGARRDVYLGVYNSPESRAEYGRLIAELATGPVPAAGPAPAGPRLTVDQVLLAFLKHAEQHYRGRDGKPSGEYREFKRALAPAHKLYGHIAAADFGPRALATVRQEMVNAGLARKLINQRVGRVSRAFRWAASQELVPVAVFQALRTLPGLQKGRTEARETAAVKPVDPAHVGATLPFLTPHLRALVRLQLLTGMRPGEACALTLEELDRTGDVWVYRPGAHKTAHRGHERAIVFGPKARAVLEEFLATHPVPAGATVFSPVRAREERSAELRARRKTPVPPSQQRRRKKNPKLVYAAAYTPHTYAHAVRVAAGKAQVPHWHPNRLRHAFATAVRKAHGLEAAQTLLGHARADVTQIYAARDMTLALKVAGEIG